MAKKARPVAPSQMRVWPRRERRPKTAAAARAVGVTGLPALGPSHWATAGAAGVIRCPLRWRLGGAACNALGQAVGAGMPGETSPQLPTLGQTSSEARLECSARIHAHLGRMVGAGAPLLIRS